MRACHRVLIIFLTCSLDRCYGWWFRGQANQTDDQQPRKPAKSFYERIPGLDGWMDRLEDGKARLRELSDDFDVSQWDSAIWWCLDSIVSVVGWLFFGSAWGSVRNGCRRVMQVGVIILFCIATHYVWAVCYPIVSVLVAVVVAVFWLLRRLLRAVGTAFSMSRNGVVGRRRLQEWSFMGRWQARPLTPPLWGVSKRLETRISLWWSRGATRLLFLLLEAIARPSEATDYTFRWKQIPFEVIQGLSVFWSGLTRSIYVGMNLAQKEMVNILACMVWWRALDPNNSKFYKLKKGRCACPKECGAGL